MPRVEQPVIERKLLESFAKGNVTRVPPERVPEDAFSYSENFALDDKFLPTVSLGQFKYNATPVAGAPWRGAALYIQKDGTKYYVGACGGKIWYSVAGSGTWTAYQVTLNGSAVDMTIDSTKDVEFAQYNNRLYAVNGAYPIIANDNSSDHQYNTSRMIKITGTVITSLSVSDIPQGARYIWLHQERLFLANSIAQPNAMFWTNAYFDYSTNSETNFTPVSGLNYDYIGKDDGENIAGGVSYAGQYVIVVKGRNVYRYATQGDITTWQSIRVDTNYGTMFNRTIQELDGYLYWLSALGIVRFDGNNALLVDDNIRDMVTSLQQLSVNSRTFGYSTTTDFTSGTYGSNIIDISGDQIKQKMQKVAADWNAGTLSGLQVSGDTVILNTETYQAVSGYSRRTYYTENLFHADNNPEWTTFDIGTSDRIVQIFFNGYGGSGGVNVRKIYASNTYTKDMTGWTLLVDNGRNWWCPWVYSPVGYNDPNASFRYYRFVADSWEYPNNFWATFYSYPNVPVYSTFTRYVTTGTIVTETLDFGFTPTSLGSLSVQVDLPANTSITFQTASSSDGANWDAYVSATIGSAITSALKRYLRIQATLTTVQITDGSTSYTPTLYSLGVGGTWMSPVVDLSVVPQFWGTFGALYAKSGQTVNFYIRTAETSGGVSAASFVLQTPDTNISGVTLYRYMQVMVVLDTTDYTNMPSVDAMSFEYYLSSSITNPCSYISNNTYGINVALGNSSINNFVFLMHKSGYFLFRTNRYNNIYIQDGQTIIGFSSLSDGYSHIIDSGNSDDGSPIVAYGVTKNFEMGLFRNIFYRWIVSARADAAWTFSYSIDNGTWVDCTISPSLNIDTIIKTFQGLAIGHFIKFKFTQSAIDANFQLAAIGAEYRQGREIRSDS